MDYQDHQQTRARLQALRDAGGQFKSSQQLDDLFWSMPADFAQTHPDDFSYAVSQAHTAPDLNAAFRIIIHSHTMKWIRQNDPSRCADMLTKALSILPNDTRPSQAHYLVSGPFAFQMSYQTPDAYASFFTNVLATIDDKAGAELATIRLLPNHSANVFAVFPTPHLRLPPYVLIRNGDGDLKARPMTEGLHYNLSKDALTALHRMVEEEANYYGSLNNYDMAGVLSQAALYIKPATMAPA